jgi:hypothetical protein
LGRPSSLSSFITCCLAESLTLIMVQKYHIYGIEHHVIHNHSK